jgi:hypothetical protein
MDPCDLLIPKLEAERAIFEVALRALRKNTNVYRCPAARSVAATLLYLALVSEMGNSSRLP